MTEPVLPAPDPFAQLPKPVAERTRQVLARAASARQSGPGQRQSVAAQPGRRGGEGTRPVYYLVAMITRVVCLASLTLPPSATLAEVDARTQQWLSLAVEYDPGASGDSRAQRWLRIEAEQREQGDLGNAVVARACAISFSLPRHELHQHPLGDGVDRADLAVGAAGAYDLPASTWPKLALVVRIYLKLE